MLTKKDIKHLAKIANLYLTDDEIERYASELDSVLEYVKVLDSIDTSDVLPTFHVNNDTNRFQSSNNYEKETLSNKSALKNAARSKDGYIVAKSRLKG